MSRHMIVKEDIPKHRDTQLALMLTKLELKRDEFEKNIDSVLNI